MRWLSLLLITAFTQTTNDHSPGVFAAKSIRREQQPAVTPDRLRALLLDKRFHLDMDPLWSQLGVEPTEFRDCSFCRAELKFAGPERRGPAVIRFDHLLERSTRFLILEQVESEAPWRLTSYIDLIQQWEPPRYSIAKTLNTFGSPLTPGRTMEHRSVHRP